MYKVMYMPIYTEAEQDLFLKAINELQKEGKVDCQVGGFNCGISLK